MAIVKDWLWIYGYKNRYKITTKGEVFRAEHIQRTHNQWEKKITPYLHSGKCYIRIYTDKKENKYHVGQLMLKTFLNIKPKPNKECIAHKNGNPMDNSIENLHIIPIGEAQAIARYRRNKCIENPMTVEPKKIKGEIRLEKGYYTVDISK